MSECLIDFNDAIIWENKAWFFSNDFNGLYSLDLSNQKIEFRGRVPFEPQFGQYLYSSIVIWENKIYLIPFKARTMAVYDIASGNFKQLYLFNDKREQFFNGNCLYENYLFLFHFFNEIVLRIDLKSETITVIDEWIDKVSPNLFGKSDPYFSYFRKQLVRREEKIYIPFCYANAVLEIDCKSLHSKIHIIDTVEQGYVGICEDGENLWLAPKRRNGAVVRWNPETGHKDIFPCKDDSDSFAYIGIVKECGQIFLYSAEELQQFPQSSAFKVKPGKYRFVSVSERYILALDVNKNTLIIYDNVTDEKKEIMIYTEYENTPLLYEFKEHVVKESQTQSLFRLFDAINMEKKDLKEPESQIGESIYRAIKTGKEKK